MPRRRINSVLDAANLLADSAIRTSRGELTAHQLHAITSALSAYGSLVQSHREALQRSEVSRTIDNLLGDSPGAALHMKKLLMPSRR